MLNIMDHNAHHCAPGIPLYNLTHMQQQLDARQVVEWDWSMRGYFDVVRQCKLFDYASGQWIPYPESALGHPTGQLRLHGRNGRFEPSLGRRSSRRHSAADQHLVTNLDRAVSHKKDPRRASEATGGGGGGGDCRTWLTYGLKGMGRRGRGKARRPKGGQALKDGGPGNRWILYSKPLPDLQVITRLQSLPMPPQDCQPLNRQTLPAPDLGSKGDPRGQPARSTAKWRRSRQAPEPTGNGAPPRAGITFAPMPIGKGGD